MAAILHQDLLKLNDKELRMEAQYVYNHALELFDQVKAALILFPEAVDAIPGWRLREDLALACERYEAIAQEMNERRHLP